MLFASKHFCVSTNNLVEQIVSPKRVQTLPIVKPEYPWEAKGVYFQGSVLKDERWPRKFRMWYSAIGERRREQQYLAYAESDDGVHFEKLLRKESAFGDWPKTNVLYGRKFNISAPNVHFYNTPQRGYRYFLVFDSRIEQHEFQFVPKKGGLTEGDKRRLMRHPNYTPGFDWKKLWPNENQTYRATYLADSKDGLQWEPEDARFGIPGQSDGDHTVAYDPARRLYRMYFRDNRIDENGHRIRQVLTATSPDTIEWSPPQLCIESDAIDDPRVNQVHGMTVTYHDGVFIGLIQMMEIEEEVVSWNPLTPFERARFHVQIAVSQDGVHFERVASRAEFFAPTEDPEAFDCGMVRCSGQWVFDGDRMLMYYDGRPYRHSRKVSEQGKVRMVSDGCEPVVGIGVAESPVDRFAGLTTLDRNRPGCVVVPILPGASALTLNCEVPEGAMITASLRYPDGCRVLKFSDDNSVPIRGGGRCAPVLWKEQRRLPSDLGPLHIRLCLVGQAVVYAMNHSASQAQEI